MKTITYVRSEDLEDVPFGGYERLVEIGLKMGQRAVDNHEEYRSLTFGFPGTGKSFYPKAMAKRLSEGGYPFSSLYVPCNTLLTSDSPQKVMEDIYKVEDYMMNPPLIVALDELDTYARIREIGTDVFTTATSGLMALLDEEREGIIIYGMVNYPAQLDLAIRSRFTYPLFFDLSDVGALSTVLQHNNIPNQEEVLKHIQELEREDHVLLSARGLGRACKRVEPIDNPEEMAMQLYINSEMPLPTSERNTYLEQHSVFITRSKRIEKYFR